MSGIVNITYLKYLEETMNLRKYGDRPYEIAVIHGGPGAAGSMMPVAVELRKHYGVLEPLQTAMSVEGQIEELRQVIEQNGELPMILVGHSWGAMLIYMFASRYPELVKCIIMIGSGALEEKFYPDLCRNRDERLSDSEREELGYLRRKFASPASDDDMDIIFARFGQLMEKLDTYEPIDADDDDTMCSYEIFTKVWPEVHSMRKKGELYDMGKEIDCPVIAIHGDYDSTPLVAIDDSLSKIIKDFTFYSINKCGHTPWNERYAKEEFYSILYKVLGKFM